MTIDKEGVQPSQPDEAWQESVFLAWYDDKLGVGGIQRIGNEINRKQSNLWCGIFDTAGQSFRLMKEKVPLVHYPDGQGFICAEQKFYLDDAGIHWAFDHPDCQVELTLTDHSSGDLWNGATSSTESVSQKGHFHKFCDVKGSVRIGNKTFEVNGKGWRDHSYGPRDWTGFLHHRCFAGTFGDGDALDITGMLHKDGVLSRGGVVVTGGQRVDFFDHSMTMAVGEDGFTAWTGDLVGTLPDGKPLSAHFEAAGSVFVETLGYFGYEAVGIVTTSDGRRGVGYMAASNNSRDGYSRPPLIQAAVWENGLSTFRRA